MKNKSKKVELSVTDFNELKSIIENLIEIAEAYSGDESETLDSLKRKYGKLESRLSDSAI